MRELLVGFLNGLEEVLRWRTTMTIIIFATLTILFWTAIGNLFWPRFLSISNLLVEWLPFAMLRSNGAWMLSTFLWLQSIMLTVAMLSLLLTVTLYRSLPKRDFTGAAGWLLLGATLFWSTVWFFKGDAIYHGVLHLLTMLPFDTVENGVSILMIFYFLYNAAIITMLFLTSLYAPVLLRRVREEVYPYESIHAEAELRSVGYTVRDTVIFITASLLLLPLLFIPVLNVLLQLLLWIWLVKDTFTYDVGALFFGSDELRRLKKGNKQLWAIAAVTALFNFFPLLNFAGPFIGEIMMFHYLVGLKSKT
jgi:hypothetical protein